MPAPAGCLLKMLAWAAAWSDLHPPPSAKPRAPNAIIWIVRTLTVVIVAAAAAGFAVAVIGWIGHGLQIGKFGFAARLVLLLDVFVRLGEVFVGVWWCTFHSFFSIKF